MVAPLITLVGAPDSGAEPLAKALAARLTAGSATLLHTTALLDALTALTAVPLTAQHGLAEPGSTLLSSALALHRRADLTLLMGLDEDVPLQGEITPSNRPSREACDALLRKALADAGVTYRVVYGQGQQRVEHALKAINSVAISAYPESARGIFDSDSGSRPARLRAWNCEKCSDPECEHRLFTALMEQSAQAR